MHVGLWRCWCPYRHKHLGVSHILAPSFVILITKLVLAHLIHGSHLKTTLKIPKLLRKILRTLIPLLSRAYRRLLRQRERCLVPCLSKSLLMSTWVSFLMNRKAGMSGWSMKWNDYPVLAFG